MNATRLLFICIAAAACAGPVRIPPGDDGTGRRLVVAKEPPSTLIAADGKICNVMPRAYADTGIGDYAVCEWRDRTDPKR